METPAEITGPINLGNPSEFTIGVLAQTVIDLARSRSQIVFKPLPEDDPLQRQPDIARARETLDWAPTVELKEGLALTIAYFDRLLRASGRIA